MSVLKQKYRQRQTQEQQTPTPDAPMQSSHDETVNNHSSLQDRTLNVETPDAPKKKPFSWAEYNKRRREERLKK